MVRLKSQSAAEIDAQVNKAVLGVQSGLYKSLYEAAKQLSISKDTVTCHVNEGLLCSQARQKQQKLLYTQKNVLLKWVNELTISGYLSEHHLLKKIAEKLCMKQTYDLDNASLDSLKLSSQYKLDRDWVSQFIIWHSHLTVAIEC